jgi:hypothetical protein
MEGSMEEKPLINTDEISTNSDNRTEFLWTEYLKQTNKNYCNFEAESVSILWVWSQYTKFHLSMFCPTSFFRKKIHSLLMKIYSGQFGQGPLIW